MLQRNAFLLFPVVPDVLDIVIIFHDVDEFFVRKTGRYMQKPMKLELLFDKCSVSVSGFLAMYVTANCGIKGLISIADKITIRSVFRQYNKTN